MRRRIKLVGTLGLLLLAGAMQAQLTVIWQRPDLLPDSLLILPGMSGALVADYSRACLLPLPDGRLQRIVLRNEEVVSVTPNGRWLVTVSGSRVRVRSLPDFALVREIDPPDIGRASGAVQHTNSAFPTPDGTHLLVSIDACEWVDDCNCMPVGYAVMLVRVADGQVIWERVQDEELFLLALSPDGQQALVENSYKVEILRVSDGAVLYSLPHRVVSTAYSPDGQLFALGHWNGTVTLHRASDGTLVRTFQMPGNRYAQRLRFSPNSSYLAALEGERVLIWDVSTGTTLSDIEPHGRATRSVDFYNNEQLLTLGEEMDYTLTTRLLDWQTGASVRQWLWVISRCSQVRFTPDGQSLGALSGGYLIIFWSLSDGLWQHMLKVRERIELFEFLPGQSAIVTAGPDQVLRLRDLATGGQRWGVVAHDSALTDIASSPDGARIATASYERVLKWWNAANGTLLNSFGSHLGGVTAIDVSPDGTLLASASYDGTVRLWQTATGMLLRIFSGHSGTVWDVAFIPNSTLLVSAGADGTLRLWDIGTGTALRTWQAAAGGVYRLGVSPTGHIIASTGEDGALRFWTRTAELLWTLTPPPAFRVIDFDFSSQSPYFAHILLSESLYDSLTVMATFTLPGDVDRNGCVDDGDLLQVLFAFGQTGDVPADVDGNGVVDDGDLLIVLFRFGLGCE